MAAQVCQWHALVVCEGVGMSTSPIALNRREGVRYTSRDDTCIYTREICNHNPVLTSFDECRTDASTLRAQTCLAIVDNSSATAFCCGEAEGLLMRASGGSDIRRCMRGSVWSRGCKAAFKKHVLPILRKP